MLNIYSIDWLYIEYNLQSSGTSGSFVRPGRVLRGVDLETAVREKYQTPPPDTAPTELLLQQAINARFVQFVGMDKISKQQRLVGRRNNRALTACIHNYWRQFCIMSLIHL